MKTAKSPKAELGKHKASLENDIYAGLHPELARLARLQNAKPFRVDDSKQEQFAGLFDEMSSEETSEFIHKLRHGK